MKTFCILVLLAFLSFFETLHSQIVYDDFESIRRISYRFSSGTLVENSNNPGPDGTNLSPTCAKYTRNSTNLFDQITIDVPFPLDSVRYYINRNKFLYMDVFSPAPGIVIEITLLNDSLAAGTWPAGRHSQYNDTTTKVNAWERMVFEHFYQPDSTVSDDILDAISISIAPNTNLGSDFYLDNIRGPAWNDPCLLVPGNDSIFEDFECNNNLTYFFTSGNLTTVPNPEKQFINSSNFAGKYERDGGSADDVIVGSPGRFLDLSEDHRFKLQIYDPDPPHDIILSLKNDDGMNPATTVFDILQNTAFQNDWQELFFDASPVKDCTHINLLVILIDPGKNSSDTYHLDNFVQVPPQDVNGIDDFRRSSFWEGKAFPNPSEGNCYFQITTSKRFQLNHQITDINGKVLLSNAQTIYPGTETLQADLSGYPPGIYFSVLEGEGKRLIEKIILLR